ncbi:MAG: fumarylacetoacetate hydrolase family protein [Beijerinckiaceae bacterium]|nr:fumarylacetoacetate hydrolase family protein [Beijerinckiaceae bacterium]
MTYVFPPQPPVSLAIKGSDARFAVRRILCVGRNYEAHAREMGNDPSREPPFFFMKPADTIVEDGAAIDYPPGTEDLHHEIELVVAIGKEGFAISEAAALDHVYGYAVGIDLTKRDVQNRAKKNSHPWDWSKGFDHSAPCGPIHPAASVGHIAKGRISISVNGVVKQDQDVADLIWSIPEIIAYASKDMRLMPGDLIFTGTPSGVASLKRGDTIEGSVAGLGSVNFSIR